MIDFMKKLLLILGAGTLLVLLVKQFLPLALGSSKEQASQGGASAVALLIPSKVFFSLHFLTSISTTNDDNKTRHAYNCL